MSIYEIHQKFIKKEISPVELAKEYLKKIAKEDKKIHSFLTISEDLAISLAKKAEKMIQEEKKVSLVCGIPCAIKDNILVGGIKCTAGSKILKDYVSPFDATVIERLKRAGAVILGKANMDEFAMGSSTENSAFFITKNPHDLERVPGGSSGGSAAAVASDFCQFALGSDTGGSIRQPASFCGVVGLKPTYGSVSRYGLVAMASSLDQIGPITKNVDDAKIVFDIIKGKDPMDSTSAEQNLKFQIPNIKHLKLGIPKEYFIEGLEKDVREKIKETIEKIERLGAQIEKISLPHTEYALATYHLIMASEASANLARYDGIRYGFKKFQTSKKPLRGVAWSDSKAQNLFEFYSEIRGKYFGKEVRRRIVLGTFALSVGYYDEYYLRAQKARRLIKEDFDKAFSKVDLILTPVSPTVAFKIGEKIDDPIKMYLADVFTVGVSLAGLPALSLSCGKVGNLPVGFQIIARPFKEEMIFRTVKTFLMNKKFKTL